MADKYASQLKKVRKARITLVGRSPFFGSLAFGVPIKFDDTLKPPTAMTNGEVVVFHPDFVDSLTPEETVFVLAHEVMHPALQHPLRHGGRDMGRFNAACDIVINQLLVESDIGKMPSFGWFRPDLYAAGEGKIEKIYNLLPKGTGEAGSGPSGGGGSMDVIGKADPSKAATQAADWRNKLQQALQTAKKAGNVPGSIEALVEQLTVPKVRWQDKLRNLLMPTKGQDRTWAKRNRRYTALDIMIPGRDGERLGELVYAIDCSGSTSDQMIGQCTPEIASIQEELRPEKIHVIYFDTDIKKHEEYEPDDPLSVKAYGRGGTLFSPVFKYIADNGITPDACIVATDMGSDDYGPEPPYPVIWAVLEGQPYMKPPWGQLLAVG